MILTLLFCMFGGIFAKTLPDINRELTRVLEEFQKYKIDTPEGFEESIRELNYIYGEIFEDINLKGRSSQNSFNPLIDLTKLIRIFIERYSNMYKTFEEFYNKWENGEIEISESLENNSTSEEIPEESSVENNSTSESSSVENDSTESNSTSESSSVENESEEESSSVDNSTELTYPEELLKLYEGIIESMKLELYPALLYFDSFTNEIFKVIDQKTLALNYELFKNRLKFDMTPEGVEFKYVNNPYYKLFNEFNNSVEEVIEDYTFDADDLFKTFNETYIFNRTLSELKSVFDNTRHLKRDSEEELNRKFNSLLEKFDSLDSCIEKNETEPEPAPEQPPYYSGSNIISTFLLISFLLLLF